MASYMKKAWDLLAKLEDFQLQQVPCLQKRLADALAMLVSSVTEQNSRTVYIDTLERPSIDQVDIAWVTKEAGWMNPIIAYIKYNVLQTNKEEDHAIRVKASRFWLSSDKKLYRCSFTGPYLLCVPSSKIENLLYEIHEGVCGMHTGGRSLTMRSITQGYWWPYMPKDAKSYVKKCEKCQRFAWMIHQPMSKLHPLTSP